PAQTRERKHLDGRSSANPAKRKHACPILEVAVRSGHGAGAEHGSSQTIKRNNLPRAAGGDGSCRSLAECSGGGVLGDGIAPGIAQQLETLGAVFAYAGEDHAHGRNASAGNGAIQEIGRGPRAFHRLAVDQLEARRLPGLEEDVARRIGSDMDDPWVSCAPSLAARTEQPPSP